MGPRKRPVENIGPNHVQQRPTLFMGHQNFCVETDLATVRSDLIAQIDVFHGRSRTVGAKPSDPFEPISPNRSARTPKCPGTGIPVLMGKAMQEISELRNKGWMRWITIVRSKGGGKTGVSFKVLAKKL